MRSSLFQDFMQRIWWFGFVTDVSGKSTGPIIEGQADPKHR